MSHVVQSFDAEAKPVSEVREEKRDAAYAAYDAACAAVDRGETGGPVYVRMISDSAINAQHGRKPEGL